MSLRLWQQHRAQGWVGARRAGAGLAVRRPRGRGGNSLEAEGSSEAARGAEAGAQMGCGCPPGGGGPPRTPGHSRDAHGTALVLAALGVGWTDRQTDRDTGCQLFGYWLKAPRNGDVFG